MFLLFFFQSYAENISMKYYANNNTTGCKQQVLKKNKKLQSWLFAIIQACKEQNL